MRKWRSKNTPIVFYCTVLYFSLILQILPTMPKNFTTSKIFNVSDQFGIWLYSSEYENAVLKLQFTIKSTCNICCYKTIVHFIIKQWRASKVKTKLFQAFFITRNVNQYYWLNPKEELREKIRIELKWWNSTIAWFEKQIQNEEDRLDGSVPLLIDL